MSTGAHRWTFRVIAGEKIRRRRDNELALRGRRQCLGADDAISIRLSARRARPTTCRNRKATTDAQRVPRRKTQRVCISRRPHL
jgi:hypothetical protein